MHAVLSLDRPRSGYNPRLTVAVVAAAVVQVAVVGFVFAGPGASPAAGDDIDLSISPPGWAFAIWGPIYLLAVAHAFAALVLDAPVGRRLQRDLFGLYVAATAWIVVAAIAPDSAAATALVLVAMAAAAVDAVVVARRVRLTPRWFTVLTRTAVGLYAGWVTAAVGLNVANALVEAGLDARAVGWQLAVLVAIGALAVATLAAARGNLAYATAVVWAFAGIAVGAADRDAPALLITAAVAAGAIAAAAVAFTARPSGVPTST